MHLSGMTSTLHSLKMRVYAGAGEGGKGRGRGGRWQVLINHVPMQKNVSGTLRLFVSIRFGMNISSTPEET
jgi:hypothetical protein